MITSLIVSVMNKSRHYQSRKVTPAELILPAGVFLLICLGPAVLSGGQFPFFL